MNQLFGLQHRNRVRCALYSKLFLLFLCLVQNNQYLCIRKDIMANKDERQCT